MGTEDYFGDPVTTAGTHSIGAEDVPAPLSQVSNAGFEDPGAARAGSCYGGASAVTGNAHTGSYSVELPGRVSSGRGTGRSRACLRTPKYQLEGFGKTEPRTPRPPPRSR
jgi:hypothetical protein